MEKVAVPPNQQYINEFQGVLQAALRTVTGSSGVTVDAKNGSDIFDEWKEEIAEIFGWDHEKPVERFTRAASSDGYVKGQEPGEKPKWTADELEAERKQFALLEASSEVNRPPLLRPLEPLIYNHTDPGATVIYGFFKITPSLHLKDGDIKKPAYNAEISYKIVYTMCTTGHCSYTRYMQMWEAVAQNHLRALMLGNYIPGSWNHYWVPNGMAMHMLYVTLANKHQPFAHLKLRFSNVMCAAFTAGATARIGLASRDLESLTIDELEEMTTARGTVYRATAVFDTLMLGFRSAYGKQTWMKARIYIALSGF
ncbi:unnamed protein product, partial [Mesorhabditis spiculigera]